LEGGEQGASERMGVDLGNSLQKWDYRDEGGFIDFVRFNSSDSSLMMMTIIQAHVPQLWKCPADLAALISLILLVPVECHLLLQIMINRLSRGCGDIPPGAGICLHVCIAPIVVAPGDGSERWRTRRNR
jgi:hypothetical protein